MQTEEAGGLVDSRQRDSRQRDNRREYDRQEYDREEGRAQIRACQKSGSQELRNRLIVRYLPIVRSAAAQLRSMAGSSLEQEDLVDQGVLALMECLERYDETKGAQFETYAFIRVRGAMLDYIRSQDWVPHRARSFQKKVEEAYSLLSHEKMREPDVAEVADYLNLPAEKVESHLRYMNHAAVLSFETVLQDMTGMVAKGELETSDIAIKPEESLFYKELKKTLADAINGLGEKERLVITLYYYEELKYSEIAEVMGIGQSRVCQIHTKAVRKLKDSQEEYMRG